MDQVTTGSINLARSSSAFSFEEKRINIDVF